MNSDQNSAHDVTTLHALPLTLNLRRSLHPFSLFPAAATSAIQKRSGDIFKTRTLKSLFVIVRHEHTFIPIVQMVGPPWIYTNLKYIVFNFM